MRVLKKGPGIVEDLKTSSFLENTPNVKGNGPDWLFDVDSLTISMNYVPVVAGNQTNGIAGTKDNIVSEYTSSTNSINTVSTPVITAGPSFDNVVPSPPVNTVGPSISTANAFEEHLFEQFSLFKNAFTLSYVPNVSSMDNTGIFGNAYDDVEEEVDIFNNTRHMTKITDEHGLFSSVHKLRRINHKDFHNCLFACFLSQMEPKKPVQALKDPSWVEAMQDELLQFKVLKVWTLVDLPRDKWAIVQQKSNEIFISQDKYVAEILKKFDFASVKTANTPIETNKALIKDEEAEDVDVHLYRSVIGSLMYLTASRPDIMFAVCAYARFQVTPKTSHLNALKRIFRYLKGQPKLGLWYPRDSPFDLEAFSDSDYAGASLDRKSTTGGCQFLGKRLISWQCKKKTIVANSTTEAEYVVAANCYGQNLVFHSKTKNIKIRHHFIRDSYEKKLIQVIKIHTDQNVADLLTKAFDASSIEAYIASPKLNIASIKLVLLAKIFSMLFPTLPNAEIFKQLALMGYASDSDKLTFQKGHFSPQWRFLIHTILHCLSPKKTIWEQFSSNIATAIICLATNRTFNFSKMIFKGMLENLDSRSKFLMYPRFIQIFWNKSKRHLLPHKRTYVAPTLTKKLFRNMRRVSKGYIGVNIPLFPTMLTAPESSPSRITSSPSLSPQTHPSTSQQPPTPPFMQTIHDTEEPTTMPYDSSQLRVQSLGSDEGSLTLNELTVLCTTLSKKKLEHKVKASKSRRRTKIVVSDDEEVLEDPSKQGRIIAEIDQNPSISLVQDEGTSWIQEDAETQGRTSADTEILLEQEEPTELVEDPGSGEKGEKEISTAEVPVSTASAIPVVSTAIPERQVYIRRSAEKRKDKGKAIMKDDESVQKKTKKQLEQERLGHEEAIRLQEQINEEERQRIARDAEIAKQLQEEIDIARQEQEKYDLAQALELQKELDKREEVVAETTQAHDIDWSDPAVLRYHAQKNRSFSKAEVKKNMCMYLKNQGGYKQSHFKGMSYEDIRPIFERVWDQNQAIVPKDYKIEKEVMKRPGFDLQKKRASEKKSEKGVKRKKMEDDTEKEELKAYLDIVPEEEFSMDVESLSTKQDVINLYRLVKQRYVTTSPEGYDLMLWGDLKTLFEQDEEDEV
ncbi:hypothetical protein Tco_0080329 [Tanacetum coccineum]